MYESVESEHPRLSNHEIIFEELQPVKLQSTDVTDGRTERGFYCALRIIVW